MKDIIPVIDTETLQQKANEYAQKGAEETLKEFYSGYRSPYKTAIEESLKNRVVDTSFELPDIVSSINDSLSNEIDKIANTAVAKTFIPLVTRMLTRAEKEMNFSDLLEEFIECNDFNHDDEDFEDYYVEFEKEEDSFIRLSIHNGKDQYEIALSNFHKHNDKRELIPFKERGWTIYSLPFTYRNQREQTMKISIDGGATLEIPFRKGVLDNPFVSFVATLVMAETKIYFNVKEFSEEMFPERDHCDY